MCPKDLPYSLSLSFSIESPLSTSFPVYCDMYSGGKWYLRYKITLGDLIKHGGQRWLRTFSKNVTLLVYDMCRTEKLINEVHEYRQFAFYKKTHSGNWHLI